MKTRIVRRLCALLLCFALFLGMSAEVFAYEGVSPWAQEEVAAAQELGIIPASLEKKALCDPMSRLEMCHMAVNTFEVITGTSLYPAKLDHFTDTRDADVCVAYELGLVSGYPDGTFAPEKRISRQEFSKIVTNLLSALGWSEDAQTLGAFVDDVQVDAWAVEAAARMVALGVVNGSGSGKLNPKGTTSIEQACVMFLRAYHTLSSEDLGDLGGAADPVDGEYTPTYQGVSPWAREALKTMDLLGMLPESVLSAVVTEPITRGQMCELAVLTYTALTGLVPEESEQVFSDTDLPAASQASSLGLVSGFPDGSFRPEELLTRQQFFKITSNLLDTCDYREETDAELLQSVYTDADTIGPWAQEPAALLYRMGIMQGDSKGCLSPTGGTTCEQAIAMLIRTYRQVSTWCESHPLKEIVGPLTSPSVAQQVVDLALSYVGYPYVWAGANPSVGFDCSGLVYYVYKQFGYNLYRAGDGMAREGVAVEESEMQPGDIIIFSNKATGSIQHVGLYIGDGKMVHAQSSRTGVVISQYDYDTSKYIYSIRRIIT